MWRALRHAVTATVGVVVTVSMSAHTAVGGDDRQKLSADQFARYQQIVARRHAHESFRARYWSDVARHRSQRQTKRRSGQPISDADFARQHPPILPNVAMPPDIVAALPEPAPESKQTTSIPTLADIMAAAIQHHGFAPRLVAETEFKRRYAEAALVAGIEPNHVIRVYALETGGMGTFDMQSGINHETGRGRPASTALGYSQLLAANTIGEVAKRGEAFIRILEQRAAGSHALRRELPRRIEALHSMMGAARRVPGTWAAHVDLARTPQGFGIHALNLDGEIGPILQIGKLRDLLITARRELGRERISGAELELMNLAGPRNGLDMILEPGRRMPTANFFTMGGYSRNPIVHGKTGEELLATLDQRMNAHMTKSGTQEFIAAFERLTLAPIVEPLGRRERSALGAAR